MRDRLLAPFCTPGYFRRTYVSGRLAILTCSLGLILFATTTLSSCSTPPVVIEKAAPEIKTQIFDKGLRPPEASPPEHNDCANTHWHYGIMPAISYDTKLRERVSDGEEVVIKITKINIKLNLEVTMWLPEKASEDVIAHERGHAAICLDAYKSAETYAKAAADAFIGKEIRARGSDYETTLKRALTDVKQEIVRNYNEETVVRANFTAGLYDKITVTDHAAAKVDQKVADAEIEYKRILPQLKVQREEEEQELLRRQEALEKKRQEAKKAKSSTSSETGPAPSPVINPAPSPATSR